MLCNGDDKDKKEKNDGDNNSNKNQSRSRRQRERRRSTTETTIIKIVSAMYGPCETLLTESSSRRSSNKSNSNFVDDRITLSRDCVPFVRNLLTEARKREKEQYVLFVAPLRHDVLLL